MNPIWRLQRMLTLRRSRNSSIATAKTGDPWWESKLLLLVLGAALTNFLAPRIQDSLEAVKWQRQQQVQQGRQSIQAMERFIGDFADLQARSIQLDVLSRTALIPRSNAARIRSYDKAFEHSINAWYTQTARVSGQLMLFKENGTIREEFQRYCSITSDALLSYREAVLNNDKASLLTRRAASSEKINDLYESVLNLSREEVFRAQVELSNELSRKKDLWTFR